MHWLFTVDFVTDIDIKVRTHSRKDFPSLSLLPSIQITLQSSPSQITGWEVRGGTDLRPWIHYGPSPITSLKCPVACCLVVSLQKRSDISPEGLTVIKQVTEVSLCPTSCPLSRWNEQLQYLYFYNMSRWNTCFAAQGSHPTSKGSLSWPVVFTEEL